jgi:branched-chain amino acid aminotransferase
MPPRTEKIWMDGELVPWDEAKVHVLSHGLHYGTSCFEGLRCYSTPRGPAIFRLRDHVLRLFQTASMLFMRVPHPLEELEEVCRLVVRENHLEDCYVRPLLYYGLGGMNFSFRDNPVHLACAVWPWGAYLGEEGREVGIRCLIASWMKTPTNAIPSTAKISGSYVNGCMAYQEAMRAGCDEAILLNQNGNVAEGTGENVFIVKERRLFTPPVSAHIVAGLTRDAVMHLARDLGYEVEERDMTRGELLQADEVFLTGTAAEVTPVRELDFRPIGIGSAGPVTREIQASYHALVHGKLDGKMQRYGQWLSHVYHDVS